jgi:glycosyltransferase involved in cell wall biosynthesis
MPGTRQEVEQAAASVRSTGLLNESFYRSHLGPDAAGLDPATHYDIVGERMGLAPSPEFDPRYYGARNPDVRDAAINYLEHYAHHGRAEGRLPKPADVRSPGRAKFDAAKDNVILVVHETSRTGAPILGWNLALHLAWQYNLFTVRMGDGDLTDEFERLSVEVYGPFLAARHCAIDVEFSLRGLLEARKYRYVIANSAATRLVVEPCVRRFIPTVLLVHEFASYMGPPSHIQDALDWSTEIVYSASMVAKSSEEVHPNLRSRTIHVIPQGRTALPPGGTQSPEDEAPFVLDKLAANRQKDHTFIVLGLGFVHFRKGVDLFLSTAAAVMRHQPRRSIHFLWVGDGYRPKEDMAYSVYLQEQLNRSGLAGRVTFLDGVSDLDPVYRIADAFLLSSRLDPLPNVTIDAAVRGIPVVCFQHATGMADLMLDDPVAAVGVVDYVDAAAAAEKILELAGDDSLRQRFSGAMVELAQRHFDMESYVRRLDELGTKASGRMKQRQADARTLASDPTFDQDMFLGPTQGVETRHATISRYLALSSARGWDTLPATDHYFRRPAPGFNPRVYAAAHESRLAGVVDPLADFIRRGKPLGPWQSTVLRPDDPIPRTHPPVSPRAALHLHLFYPELCRDFLAHLEKNQTGCDLFISTDSPAKADHIRRSLSGYARGRLDVRTVPNRGRDIGPLLTEFADDLNGYDFIGHLHAKRSQWMDGKPAEDTWGEAWREFLWQNLLGGLHPMMDRIIAGFAHDPSLGLVFPGDPNLVGWGENKDLAAKIAARLGWQGPLPDHFDFPLGNMFWIRRDALQPFLDLCLTWDQYPDEPVSYPAPC